MPPNLAYLWHYQCHFLWTLAQFIILDVNPSPNWNNSILILPKDHKLGTNWMPSNCVTVMFIIIIQHNFPQPLTFYHQTKDQIWKPSLPVSLLLDRFMTPPLYPTWKESNGYISLRKIMSTVCNHHLKQASFSTIVLCPLECTLSFQ